MWKIKKLIRSLETARGSASPLPPMAVFACSLSHFRKHYFVMRWCSEGRVRGTDLCTNRRNGTSMISLIIPPKDQISRVSKMLSDEYGTASNIKSRVNRCAARCSS